MRVLDALVFRAASTPVATGDTWPVRSAHALSGECQFASGKKL
jgi:hypothetical protein